MDSNVTYEGVKAATLTLNYTWPFVGGLSACELTGNYGVKRPKDDGTYRWHLGVDLSAYGGAGTPVVACTNGKVLYVGWDPNQKSSSSRGFMVILDHTDDAAQSWYCHLQQKSAVTVGQVVSAGTIIGYEGSTGASTAPHLHFQICTYQGTVKNRCGYTCSTYTLSDSKTFDPIFFLTSGIYTSNDYKGRCESGNLPYFYKNENGEFKYTIVTSDAANTSEALYNLNIGGNALLSPSNDERKYGVTVYDTVQSLIRGATASSISNKGDVYDALDRYARYLYYYLNTSITVATVQTMSMPWIRPGFNVWLDPLLIDRVYYVNGVQHNGSAQGGVFTTLSLSFGRNRTKFQEMGYEFGSLTLSANDNIFVNTMNVRPEHFSKNIISDAATFNAIKAKIDAFYSEGKTDSPGFEKAAYHDHLQWLYNTINNECGTVSGSYTAPAIGAASNTVNDVAETTTSTVQTTSTTFDGTYKQGDIILITGYAYPSSSGKGESTKLSRKKGVLSTVGATNAKYPYYVKGIGWVAKSSLSFVSRTTSETVTTTKYVSPAATAEYDSVAEIQKMLDAKYANAPAVIQNRIARHRKIIAAAKIYIADHYIREEQ